jgi:hypothetical protein
MKAFKIVSQYFDEAHDRWVTIYSIGGIIQDYHYSLVRPSLKTLTPTIKEDAPEVLHFGRVRAGACGWLIQHKPLA